MYNITPEALNEVVARYEDLRSSFRSFTSSGQLNKHTLNEYQHRFMDIAADLRPFKQDVNAKWLRHDDKCATALKGRIAIQLSEGNIDGYEKMSLNQADKYASSTPHYKDFLQKRAFYKESLNNIEDLRMDVSGYVYLIKDYIKDCRD